MSSHLDQPLMCWYLLRLFLWTIGTRGEEEEQGLDEAQEDNGSGCCEAGEQVAVVDRTQTEIAVAAAPREERAGLGEQPGWRAPLDHCLRDEHRLMPGSQQGLAERGVLGELDILGENLRRPPRDCGEGPSSVPMG